MTPLRTVLAPLTLSLAILRAGAVEAQTPASSLGDLKPLAMTRSTVFVSDTQGRTFRGTIAAVSESGLALRIGDTIRQFAVIDVGSVRVRKADPLVNGALIGAATSGGLVSLMFLDNECHDDPACYQAVAAYAGIGALAGLAIDALNRRSVVVYSRPSSPATRHVFTLTPMIQNGLKGVRVRVDF
jgi:hypothetical protein